MADEIYQDGRDWEPGGIYYDGPDYTPDEDDDAYDDDAYGAADGDDEMDFYDYADEVAPEPHLTTYKSPVRRTWVQPIRRAKRLNTEDDEF